MVQKYRNKMLSTYFYSSVIMNYSITELLFSQKAGSNGLISQFPSITYYVDHIPIPRENFNIENYMSVKTNGHMGLIIVHALGGTTA